MNGISVSALLLGGLGNQLFQLAAGLTASGGTPITLLHVPGFTDHATGSEPAIADLNFSPEVARLESASWKQTQLLRGCSRLMRESMGPNSNRQHLSTRISSYIAMAGIIIGRDLGYCCDLYVRTPPKRRLLVGYWQSWRYAEAAKDIYARHLRVLAERSCSVHHLLRKAREPGSVALHVRLGDYQDFGGFGALGADYYRQALRALEVAESDTVFVFSDDPSKAAEMLLPLAPKYSFLHVELEGPRLSALELLLVMRASQRIVVANSSLSWWAAYLAEWEGADVAAPWPWFIGAQSPNELLPPSWILVPRS